MGHDDAKVRLAAAKAVIEYSGLAKQSQEINVNHMHKLDGKALDKRIAELQAEIYGTGKEIGVAPKLLA